MSSEVRWSIFVFERRTACWSFGRSLQFAACSSIAVRQLSTLCSPLTLYRRRWTSGRRRASAGCARCRAARAALSRSAARRPPPHSARPEEPSTRWQRLRRRWRRLRRLRWRLQQPLSGAWMHETTASLRKEPIDLVMRRSHVLPVLLAFAVPALSCNELACACLLQGGAAAVVVRWARPRPGTRQTACGGGGCPALPHGGHRAHGAAQQRSSESWCALDHGLAYAGL